MPDTRNSVVHDSRRVFDDFFKLWELRVSHEQLDGTTSAEQRRLVCERGDAVAVLLFNGETEEVVLVNQFRAPTLPRSLWSGGTGNDNRVSHAGWILELIAGMVPEAESTDPRQTAARETKEETGYEIEKDALEHIATFFTSPGGSSERIFLYFATVRGPRPAEHGGLADEDIEIKHVPPAVLFEMLNKKQLEDAKLLIGAMWLRDRLREQRLPVRG